jgi:hypothetical protein
MDPRDHSAFSPERIAGSLTTRVLLGLHWRPKLRPFSAENLSVVLGVLRFATLIGIIAACSPGTPDTPSPDTISSDHLFVWTAAADSTHPDFLAVLDVRAEGDRYGTVVATLTVPGLRTTRTTPSTRWPATGSCSPMVLPPA